MSENEMTPDAAEKRVIREGFCYLCERDNDGADWPSHYEYCPWPEIRAAWEADRKRIEALERRLEEAVWLINHDQGDIGGVGRKRWLARRDALFSALRDEEAHRERE